MAKWQARSTYQLCSRSLHSTLWPAEVPVENRNTTVRTAQPQPRPQQQLLVETLGEECIQMRRLSGRELQ